MIATPHTAQSVRPARLAPQTAAHTDHLARSGIPPAIVRERAYRSVADHDPSMAHLPSYQQLAGLAIPIYRLGVYYTTITRPDTPRTNPENGKPIKYDWQTGLPMVLDCLPRYIPQLADTTIPIWFTEGAKKADALTGLGERIVPIDLFGVWCWKHKNADGVSVPLADFDAIALKGRRVVVAYDSDQQVNPHVAQARDSLIAFLVSRGAIVGNLVLPHGETKLGVDDAIADAWTFAQLEAAIQWRPRTAPRFSVEPESTLMDLPPIRYLDRDLGLIAGAFHLIYGASGSGKTFYAIERAMRQVALGRRVLYIATEDVQGLRYRVVAWRRAHPEATGTLTWLQMPEGLDLQDYNQVAELIEAVEPYTYDHIILDTLREAHSGDENSSQDTRRINRAIQRLLASGAAVDVVHHTGVAGERPRGSTALFGNADAVIKVEDDDGAIRINFDKLRNAPPRDSLLFGMVQQDTGLTDTDGEPVVSVVLRPAGQFTRRDAKLTPTQRKVLQALALSIFEGIGAKAQQVIDTAEITRRHVYLALAMLKTRGYVAQGDKGEPYTITTAGRAQLGPEYMQQPSDLPDSALAQASDPAFVAPAPASDLTNTAPVRASDPSDQQVIACDLHTPGVDVIHSDHTRRVITGSHTDHMRSHDQKPEDWTEDLPADLPKVPDAMGLIDRLHTRQRE